jgi:hypothetical protein
MARPRTVNDDESVLRWSARGALLPVSGIRDVRGEAFRIGFEVEFVRAFDAVGSPPVLSQVRWWAAFAPPHPDQRFEDVGKAVNVALAAELDGSAGSDPERSALGEAKRRFALFDQATDAARTLRSRPHGRSYGDEWWGAVATVHNGFSSVDLSDPTARLAREAGVPLSTASKWVSRTRELELLDPHAGLHRDARAEVTELDAFTRWRYEQQERISLIEDHGERDRARQAFELEFEERRQHLNDRWNPPPVSDPDAYFGDLIGPIQNRSDEAAETKGTGQ